MNEQPTNASISNLQNTLIHKEEQRRTKKNKEKYTHGHAHEYLSEMPAQKFKSLTCMQKLSATTRWRTYSSPVEPVVRADQDVVLVFEIVLHVFSLYPNTNADDFCMVVRSVHFFDAVSGCTSLPDALSHETWVYPSSAAASRCPFGDFVVSVCARLGISAHSHSNKQAKQF